MLKWFKERRWKAWEMRKKWEKIMKRKKGVEKESRKMWEGELDYSTLKKKVVCPWRGRQEAPLIAAWCMFFLSVFGGEECTWPQGQVQMFASEELWSMRHGKQSHSGRIFLHRPCICLAGCSPSRQMGANCTVWASVSFPNPSCDAARTRFISLF